MALRPRRFKNLSRDLIRQAIISWKAQRSQGNTQTFRQFLESRPAIQNLKERDVDVSQRDDFDGETVDIVDMILLDIRSYVPDTEMSDAEVG